MKQILIVDDDQHVLDIMSLILKEEGYDVIEAKGGKEALQALHESNISLVITDIIMPDKEGLETIKEIRAIRTGIKIIAMSGGSAVYLNMARKLGADQIITKPFATDELIETVKEMIEDQSIPKSSDQELGIGR